MYITIWAMEEQCHNDCFVINKSADVTYNVFPSFHIRRDKIILISLSGDIQHSSIETSSKIRLSNRLFEPVHCGKQIRTVLKHLFDQTQCSSIKKQISEKLLHTMFPITHSIREDKVY